MDSTISNWNSTSYNLLLSILLPFLLARIFTGCGSDDEAKPTAAVFAVEGETCGNGVLDLHPTPPPDCPNPNTKTNVSSRPELDAWLADPTTSLDIKNDITFSDEALEIVTACDVFTTSAAQLAGLPYPFISARNVDISSYIEATGRADFRGEESVIIRQASTFDGPLAALAMEAPTVDYHGDTTYETP